jgi:hypothetical protein
VAQPEANRRVASAAERRSFDFMGGGRGGEWDAGERRKFRKIWVGSGGNEAAG